MGNTEFIIEKKTRESISKSNKVYRFLYGLILFIAGIILILKQEQLFSDKYSFISWGMILIGLSFVLYGLIGKNIFASKIFIQINEDSIKIKKPFRSTTTIELSTITYLKFLPLSLELSFTDYAKTFNLSLLTQEEFDKVKEKLTEYCVKKNIQTE